MKSLLSVISLVLVLFVVMLPSKALALTGPEDPYSFSAIPGQTYYFSLLAEKNGSIVLWSSPVRAFAR